LFYFELLAEILADRGKNYWWYLLSKTSKS